MICEVCKKEFTVKVRPRMDTLCSMECYRELGKLLDDALKAMKKFAHENPEAFLNDEDFHVLR